MLWELSVTGQRYRAVLEVLAGVPVTEVAGRYGVSRQSVHAWLGRYRSEGPPGLADRSHKVHAHPWEIPAQLESAGAGTGSPRCPGCLRAGARTGPPRYPALAEQPRRRLPGGWPGRPMLSTAYSRTVLMIDKLAHSSRRVARLYWWLQRLRAIDGEYHVTRHDLTLTTVRQAGRKARSWRS
jgi:Helix-turn-helix domain